MRQAFTLIELIFVIVILGILAAVALPKFSETSIMAHDTKAKDTIMAVQSAVNTLRQKQILRGTFQDLNRTALGYDASTHEVFGKVLTTPV